MEPNIILPSNGFGPSKIRRRNYIYIFFILKQGKDDIQVTLYESVHEALLGCNPDESPKHCLRNFMPLRRMGQTTPPAFEPGTF